MTYKNIINSIKNLIETTFQESIAVSLELVKNAINKQDSTYLVHIIYENQNYNLQSRVQAINLRLIVSKNVDVSQELETEMDNTSELEDLSYDILSLISDKYDVSQATLNPFFYDSIINRQGWQMQLTINNNKSLDCKRC